MYTLTAQESLLHNGWIAELNNHLPHFIFKKDGITILFELSKIKIMYDKTHEYGTLPKNTSYGDLIKNVERLRFMCEK